ncbi:MAG TPA: rhodanese-like domain-containing protein, partial [Candidatus Paceibacterota bacterium]|nr:rhodanese-like domain-containing protein [Candidatus Paceibacterota bacterium]
KGADGWVAYGGKWNGGIKFRSSYNEDRYKIVFTTDQVKQYVQSGAVIVDSRNIEKYNRRHIPGSISIPIIYTPSSKIEEVLRQVPPASTVITVCDDFVSCFDATVTGVKLEKKGHTFLGRYNRPWEY